MLTPEEENEIQELAPRLGQPLRWQREYPITNRRNADWARTTVRRRGEAILVVPRPNETYLFHTKSSYPEGIYRLPSGGVNRGEGVEHAARRETQEEMGFELPMARFLGVVENVFVVDGERLCYPSYIFLTPPTTAKPRVMDPHEQISDFRELALAAFPRVIAQLEGLLPEWQPWGQFRAAPHALALEALTQDRGRRKEEH